VSRSDGRSDQSAHAALGAEWNWSGTNDGRAPVALIIVLERTVSV
jgi:hypothetical protein